MSFNEIVTAKRTYALQGVGSFGSYQGSSAMLHLKPTHKAQNNSSNQSG